MNIKKRCGNPQCRNLIERSQQFCSEHKGETNRFYNEYRNKYDTKRVKFYKSKEWARVRKVALRKSNYLCVNCLKDGIYTIAEQVHHELHTGTEQGWRERLNVDLLMPVCIPCHNSIEESRRK